MVNNNAAALFLALVERWPSGREVILVSRGELVEIGGSFRVPEIMRWPRRALREVGTTNRTHLARLQRAIAPDTACCSRSTARNFRGGGLHHDSALAELAASARERGLPLVEGPRQRRASPTRVARHPGEPTPRRSAGRARISCSFSGDKLLGGPQAGIVLGRNARPDRALKKSPLARALRADKLTLAALTGPCARSPAGPRATRLPVLCDAPRLRPADLETRATDPG